jgi:hypothetical protein
VIGVTLVWPLLSIDRREVKRGNRAVLGVGAGAGITVRNNRRSPRWFSGW